MVYAHVAAIMFTSKQLVAIIVPITFINVILAAALLKLQTTMRIETYERKGLRTCDNCYYKKVCSILLDDRENKPCKNHMYDISCERYGDIRYMADQMREWSNNFFPNKNITITIRGNTIEISEPNYKLTF